MSKAIAILLAWMSASTVFGKTLNVNADRTILITGPIAENVMVAAPVVEELSDESKEPIYLIINSLGGSVETGLVLISAIRVAKARGVPVICVSGVGVV